MEDKLELTGNLVYHGENKNCMWMTINNGENWYNIVDEIFYKFFHEDLYFQRAESEDTFRITIERLY